MSLSLPIQKSIQDGPSPKTMELLEKDIGETFVNIGIGTDFWKRP